MIGTVAAAPVSVLIGPLRHVRRVDGVGGETGYYNGHRRRTTGVAANGICSVWGCFPTFIELIVIDNLCFTVRKNDAVVRKTWCGEFCLSQPLIDAVSQKYSQILRVLACQELLGI